MEGLAGWPLGLEFDQVHFSYNEDKPVLRDITFVVKPENVWVSLGVREVESQVLAVCFCVCTISIQARFGLAEPILRSYPCRLFIAEWGW